jgi:hypothetical protein
VSSTYDRSGVPFEAFEKHFGHNESAVMVWKADTRTMNPSFRQEIVDKALAEDVVRYGAEHLSEWMSDVSAAYPDDIITMNVCRERRALPPVDRSSGGRKRRCRECRYGLSRGRCQILGRPGDERDTARGTSPRFAFVRSVPKVCRRSCARQRGDERKETVCQTLTRAPSSSA